MTHPTRPRFCEPPRHPVKRAAATLIAKAGLLASSLWLSSLTAPAAAQEPARGPVAGQVGIRAVLELYTSQGCSSCPPADALLQSYTARKDVVALTLPVDYWDYLGWKDTLASPKFSDRQRLYAKRRGDGRIYTPQVVINGETHVVGSSARDIDQAIAAAEAGFVRSSIPIQVRLEKGQLVIDTGNAPEGSAVKDANVWLAAIQREVEIPVRSGENRGRTLKFYNVVRELTPIGMWNGKAATIRLDRDAIAQPGVESFAVLLQSGKAGPIVGAAMLGKL